MDEIYKNDPCFWEYFVTGAPCSISATINKRLNLVNAMKGTQFSLMMNSEEEQNEVDVALHLHPPGSVIDIPCPLAVNVSFDAKLFSSEQLRALKQYSVLGNSLFCSPAYVSQEISEHSRTLETESENEVSNEDSDTSNDCISVDEQRGELNQKRKEDNVVVPILRCLSRTRKDIPGYGPRQCDPFTVTLQQRFPIDSDFAITVNRSQGQTLENVILAISH